MPLFGNSQDDNQNWMPSPFSYGSDRSQMSHGPQHGSPMGMPSMFSHLQIDRPSMGSFGRPPMMGPFDRSPMMYGPPFGMGASGPQQMDAGSSGPSPLMLGGILQAILQAKMYGYDYTDATDAAPPPMAGIIQSIMASRAQSQLSTPPFEIAFKGPAIMPVTTDEISPESTTTPSNQASEQASLPSAP